MNIEFHSEPVYGDNDKYIKTEIKSYEDKVNTNFQGNKILKKVLHTIACLMSLFNVSTINVSVSIH